MGRILGVGEQRCIDLFCHVLKTSAVFRQHTFDFLRGDPTPRYPLGVRLRVDAFFPEHHLVVEYMGEQHSGGNDLMDRRPGRRVQRARYQERRSQVLAERGYSLVRVWHHEPLTQRTVRAKLVAAGIIA